MSDTGNLLGEAASLDPAIRGRVIALANLALDQAEYLMKYGDPVTRGKLISAFMGAFSKHMRTQEASDELEGMREEMRVLQGMVMGRKPGEDTGHEGEGIGIVAEVTEMVGKDGPR